MPAKAKQQKASRKGRFAGNNVWGQREFMCDLEVPSGQLCLVRRPGITGLVKAGLLDSLDTLTVLVQTEHIDRVEPTAEGEKRKDALAHVSDAGMKALLEDPQKLSAAMDLMDRVVEYVVVAPALLRPLVRDSEGNPKLDDDGNTVPLDDDDRVEGQIYTDQVDETDKIFIFSFVMGGTEDLATFREKRDNAMAALSDVQPLEGNAG